MTVGPALANENGALSQAASTTQDMVPFLFNEILHYHDCMCGKQTLNMIASFIALERNRLGYLPANSGNNPKSPLPKSYTVTTIGNYEIRKCPSGNINNPFIPVRPTEIVATEGSNGTPHYRAASNA